MIRSTRFAATFSDAEGLFQSTFCYPYCYPVRLRLLTRSPMFTGRICFNSRVQGFEP